jgi:CubicO group peptidase (beta-lactamase class C family)
MGVHERRIKEFASRSFRDRTSRQEGWRTIPLALLALLALLAGACSADAEADTSGDNSTEAPSEGEVALGEADLSEVTDVVGGYIEDNDLNGAGLVVVDTKNGMVLEEYWGEFDADRTSLIASASKPLSAAVLLRLADEGVLDLDAPAAMQAGWDSDSPITPAQLLSNSSGLVRLHPDPTYPPYLCQYVNAGQGNLQECGRRILTTPEDDDQTVAPDTEFRYGGGQWQVAGAMAEAVSNKSWEQLVNEKLVEPCGVDSLAYNNHFTQLPNDDPFYYPPGFDNDPAVLQPTSYPNIEGGAYITPPDYAQLLLMQLRGGVCGDTQVLSPGAVETMQADRIRSAYGGDAGIDTLDPNNGYGMGWWLDRNRGTVFDPGAYGAVSMLDPDGGWGAYLVIEASYDQGVELFGQVEDAIREALAA